VAVTLFPPPCPFARERCWASWPLVLPFRPPLVWPSVWGQCLFSLKWPGKTYVFSVHLLGRRFCFWMTKERSPRVLFFFRPHGICSKTPWALRYHHLFFLARPSTFWCRAGEEQFFSLSQVPPGRIAPGPSLGRSQRPFPSLGCAVPFVADFSVPARALRPFIPRRRPFPPLCQTGPAAVSGQHVLRIFSSGFGYEPRTYPFFLGLSPPSFVDQNLGSKPRLHFPFFSMTILTDLHSTPSTSFSLQRFPHFGALLTVSECDQATFFPYRVPGDFSFFPYRRRYRGLFDQDTSGPKGKVPVVPAGSAHWTFSFRVFSRVTANFFPGVGENLYAR